MTSASFGAPGGKNRRNDRKAESTRRDMLYVVTHSIFFHCIEKNPPFWHHSCQSERTKINFKSLYKKKKNNEIKKIIFSINRYAIGKSNLKILWRNCENEQDNYSNYIHLIYWKKWKEIIMKRHTVIIHVMKV